MSLSGGQKMEDLKQLRLDALSEAEATMWGESEDQPPQKKRRLVSILLLRSAGAFHAASCIRLFTRRLWVMQSQKGLQQDWQL